MQFCIFHSTWSGPQCWKEEHHRIATQRFRAPFRTEQPLWFFGGDMDMSRIRWLVTGLSPRRPRYTPRSVHAGFVVDKVAEGQTFLQVLQFSLSISFHCNSSCSQIIREMNNRPVGGHSSETPSHPINMSNKSGAPLCRNEDVSWLTGRLEKRETTPLSGEAMLPHVRLERQCYHTSVWRGNATTPPSGEAMLITTKWEPVTYPCAPVMLSTLLRKIWSFVNMLSVMQQWEDLHPTSITQMVKTFSASVFGATLPNPTDVRLLNVK
jgi:hypothetical protein